jgi:DNA-binding helix-turn-helix protein
MRVDRYKLGHILVDKDMTATQLAELTGLSRGTISCIKCGKSCLYETAEKIAEALGVEVKDIRNYEK